jgi:IS5 family transposase
VDVASGLVRTATTIPAKVADLPEVAGLLHGKEKTVCIGAGNHGAEQRALKSV